MASPGLALRPALSRISYVLLAAPAILVLISCRQGVALDWDAVVYLSAADSMAESGALIDFHGRTLTTFAPGFPALVGLLLRVGLDFNTIGIAIAVLSAGCVTACSFFLTRRVAGSVALAWTAAAVVGISLSTVRVFAYLKTEPIFVALVLSVLSASIWAIQARRVPWWWIVSVGTLVSAATSVRYIGFTLIPMVGLAALLALKGRARLRAVAVTLTVVAVSSVGLLTVSLRNLSLGSPALGPRSPSGLSLHDVTLDGLRVVASYILPPDSPRPLRLLAAGIGVSMVLLGVVMAIIGRSEPALFLSVFVVGYVSTIAYSEVATVIQPLNERLLSPVFPVLVVLALFGWLSLVRSAAGERRRWVRASVAVGGAWAIAGVIVASVVSTVGFVTTSSHHGVGYNSLQSRQSATMAALRALPQSDEAGRIAAMNAPRVYVATRTGPVAEIPWVNFFSRPATVDAKVATLRAQVRSGQVRYLVYFAGDSSNHVLTPTQLSRAGISLRRLGAYSDGSIWAAVAVDR